MTHFLYRSQETPASEVFKGATGSGNAVDYDPAEANHSVDRPGLTATNCGHSLPRKQ